MTENIWGEEPEMPNSRDPKYDQVVKDIHQAVPTHHFRSVEYMRDLRNWKEKHDAWLRRSRNYYHGAITREVLSNILTNCQLFMMNEETKKDPLRMIKYSIIKEFAWQNYNMKEAFDWTTNYDETLSEIINKAEKWDFIRPAQSQTIIELNNKLEAIKGWVTPKEFFPVTVEEIDELKKILKGGQSMGRSETK